MDNGGKDYFFKNEWWLYEILYKSLNQNVKKLQKYRTIPIQLNSDNIRFHKIYIEMLKIIYFDLVPKYIPIFIYYFNYGGYNKPRVKDDGGYMIIYR